MHELIGGRDESLVKGGCYFCIEELKLSNFIDCIGRDFRFIWADVAKKMPLYSGNPSGAVFGTKIPYILDSYARASASLCYVYVLLLTSKKLYI
jgi:hypothetical protein